MIGNVEHPFLLLGVLAGNEIACWNANPIMFPSLVVVWIVGRCCPSTPSLSHPHSHNTSPPHHRLTVSSTSLLRPLAHSPQTHILTHTHPSHSHTLTPHTLHTLTRSRPAPIASHRGPERHHDQLVVIWANPPAGDTGRLVPVDLAVVQPD